MDEHRELDAIDLNKELSQEDLLRLLRNYRKRISQLELILGQAIFELQHIEDFKLDISEEQFVEMSLEYDSIEEYRKYEDPEFPPHSSPFFTENFLYGLFGKEDARSILAHFNAIRRPIEEDSEEIERIKRRIYDMRRRARIVAGSLQKAKRAKKAVDILTGKNTESTWKPQGALEWYSEKITTETETALKQAYELAEDVLWHFRAPDDSW